jgi:hypothetical protein
MWIRFDLNEPAAPMAELSLLGGGRLNLAERSSESNRALFFTHGLGCAECRAAIQRLSADKEAFRELGAEGLVVLPEAAPAGVNQLPGIPLLVDPADRLRKRYAGLFEFDLPGDVMMFLLDRNGSPFRAWVGEEADPQALIDESLAQLETLELRCPE